MNPLKILVACEFSGVVRDAFNARGHHAISCDLVPSEAPGPHLICDVRDLLFGESWDLIVAHPPCTYLCSSGLHWNKRVPGRAALTEDALNFVKLLLDADCPRIALENPVGCISSRVRKPDQIIQPYEFGEDASKATCLWLKGLPKLKPTLRMNPKLACPRCKKLSVYGSAECVNCGAEGGLLRPVWGNQTPSGQNKLGPSPTRAADRARTYAGVAAAFAEQWGGAE